MLIKPIPVVTSSPTPVPTSAPYWFPRSYSLPRRMWCVLTNPKFDRPDWYLTMSFAIAIVFLVCYVAYTFLNPKCREKRRQQREVRLAKRAERNERRRKHRHAVLAEVTKTENIRSVSYPGGYTRAMIGKAAMGDIGMLIGLAASERVTNDVYVTFKVYYEDGHIRHRRVLLNSDRFKRYSALCPKKPKQIREEMKAFEAQLALLKRLRWDNAITKEEYEKQREILFHEHCPNGHNAAAG